VCRLCNSCAVSRDGFEDLVGGPNGYGFSFQVSFQVSIQARMSALSARTERLAERLSFFVVSSANQRSTRFSQLLEIGGKCSLKRGCASSQRLT